MSCNNFYEFGTDKSNPDFMVATRCSIVNIVADAKLALARDGLAGQGSLG